ncbi:MAG: caspase family protein [Alphaproteobacteria bacterium]|nr:MAG: caspase family protein [Alphaproteobacteria bacterium]
MNFRQISISGRSIAMAAALFGMVSLALGAHAALNKRSLAAPEAFAVEQSAETASEPSRIALVIGNGHYPDANAPLTQPINDARALTMALRRDGFDVEVVEDASKDDMSRAIGRLKSRIKPDSVVMLFFGGYGIQVGRESYMIPVDATIWRESDVRRGAISIESVLEMMKEQGARAKLVVLDASRRNPYERRFRAFSHGLAPINAADNALVLTSATPGKVADDSAGQYSVLMAELLTNLRDQQADKPAGEADNSGGQVDNSAGEAAKPAGAETVFNKTRVAVAKSSEGEQVPSVSSSLVEEVRLGMSENSGG